METIQKVKKVIEEIRPYIQADGGDVEFVRMEDKKVFLRLKGACSCCPHSMITLKMGIQRKMIQDVPEVESVEAV